MKVAAGTRVKVKIKLQVVGGAVLEDTTLEYVQGSGKMLADLEKALEGLEPNAEKKGTLKKPFGDESKLPTKSIARKEFPKEAKLSVGEVFGAKGAKGEDISFRIIKADDKNVEVKFLHPLADKDLSFEAKIISVNSVLPPPPPAEVLELEPDVEK
jgi:FKBP-type peptidyl-prolyl cis-trans isomerase 2